jgi:hypothetical protein
LGTFDVQLSQLAAALNTDRDAFASGTTYSLLSNRFSVGWCRLTL